MVRPRIAGLALAMVLFATSGCAPAEPETPSQAQPHTPAPTPAIAEEAEPRIPPDWTQPESPSPVESCKIPDNRGQSSGNTQASQAVGFPVSQGTLPTTGTVNLIAAMVAFEDAPAPNLTADAFFAPQLEQITQWSDFWSQGSLEYEFQMVEDWVTLPVNHAEYPINSRDDYQQSRTNSARVIQMVMDSLPEDLNFADADGVLIYWSPGIDAFESDVATRGNDGVTLRTPDGPRQMFVWSGNNFHYTDSGVMTAELKREYTWSLWVYFLLLSQGLMLHAPGNGWPTGLGQSQIPSPEFSAAITAWDMFRLGWIMDDQIHCITPEDLESEQQVILTPLEIYGGERRTVIIPVNRQTDVLVVESRRPVGYSRLWDEDSAGLLVYAVNPSVGALDMMSRESQSSCGNSDEFGKWAYYLYPDRPSGGETNCNDYRAVLVREGDTVRHGGVEISLDFSDEEQDYVTIQNVGE